MINKQQDKLLHISLESDNSSGSISGVDQISEDSDALSSELTKDAIKPKVREPEESRQESVRAGKRLRDWTLWAVAILGAVLALVGYLDSRKSASRSTSVEVATYLAESWDLIGGETGTSTISRFDVTKDRAKLELARRFIDKALTLDPTNARAHYHHGIYNWGLGRIDRSIEALRRSIDLDSDYVPALIALGEILEEDKPEQNAEEAFDLYQKAAKRRSRNHLARKVLGDAYFKRGMLDEAIAEHRAALELAPEEPSILYNLGNVLMERGDLDEATEAFRSAIRMRPDHTGSHNNLGLVLSTKGQSKEAIFEFREAIRIDPANHQAHSNLGKELKSSRRLPAAILAYKEAIAINPSEDKYYFNLANTFKQAGEVRAAISHYEKALELEPRSASTHYNLGIALRELDLPKAMNHFRAAIRIEPKKIKAYYYLGNALLEIKAPAQAKDIFFDATLLDRERAASPIESGSSFEEECHRGDIAACARLGIIYDHGETQEELRLAGRYYERACSGGHANSCFNIGYLYDRGLGYTKNSSHAKSFYEKACAHGDFRGCTGLGVERSGPGLLICFDSKPPIGCDDADGDGVINALDRANFRRAVQ